MTILEVAHVSKSFRGLRALNGVSFTVEAGTILGIIGPNGAGKTTLFNAISGGFRPDRGTIIFDGTDVTAWPDYKIARAGMVRTFQIMRPFGTMTVVDNVLIATSTRDRSLAHARRQAERVVERVGLGVYANRQAAGLQTAALKRLELARALALRPRLLMLDEVLAGLVPTEREPVLHLLKEIRDEGVTMLLVEHVMPAVMRLSDEVLVLDQGQVLSFGSPEDVTRDPRVIEAYLGEEVSGADA